MNCENCGNEATIHYCLECDVLRNSRIERTPVELAAEDLLKACQLVVETAEWDKEKFGYILSDYCHSQVKKIVEKLKKK